MTTGSKYTKETLQQKATEIVNLVRKFNLREGLELEDDNLPQRLYDEPLKTGNAIKEAELKSMRHDYYSLRGWDDDGIPS
jgi:aldehyde:ferredoxin oxidoreductase